MKRRRHCGAFTGSDADDASTTTDGDSSANEYAEGLGCADRRRCREKSTSGFDFDTHPREEYFEEPRPDRAAIQSDEDEPPLTARTTSMWRSSMDRLVELERMDSERERQSKWQAQQHQKRLALLRRKCELRDAAHASTKSPIVRTASLTQRIPSSLAVVQDLCLKLQKLRVYAEKRGELTAAEAERVLQVLSALSGCHMTVCTLKGTGVGRELNLRAWRCNKIAVIARRSVELLTRWRETVRDRCHRAMPPSITVTEWSSAVCKTRCMRSDEDAALL
mmetsp:Transcript_23062/g.52950  ORF Transcript_23062/g.52950 Transcript_23062/m.52950 type:complete len:278 (+) Transcript_23062:57-890(+)